MGSYETDFYENKKTQDEHLAVLFRLREKQGAVALKGASVEIAYCSD